MAGFAFYAGTATGVRSTQRYDVAPERRPDAVALPGMKHKWIAEFNAEGWDGYSDWRLPTRSELFTLVSHARINPALPTGHLFENVFPGYYWTATHCSRLPRQAWYVHFGGGRIFRGMKHGSYLVWPVRDGA